MPILNLDLPGLIEQLPPFQRATLDAAPAIRQLAALAAHATQTGNCDLAHTVEAARRALAAPAYIGLDAVRVTVETCDSLNKIPAARCAFLAAANSTTDPALHRTHHVGKWYRLAEDRWWLTVTAADMAQAAAQMRAGAASVF